MQVKRGVNFAELLWTMLLYVLITDFGWILLVFVFLTCPIWIAFYDKARVNKAVKDKKFNEILNEE